MINTDSVIDIVLPVHNEGASIAGTLREFFQVSANNGIKVRFVICEDGSTDNTVAVLQGLQNQLPIKLITGKERKGYSRAVIDGFLASDSEWVGFIDSDGQCDPSDLASFVREAQNENDFVIGYRNPRSDHWIRILMSRSFKFVYELIFRIGMRDPSCPFLLIHRPLLQKVLAGRVGVLKQGFWWEFLARVVFERPKMCEIPVNHRPRAAGETQVYKPTKVPRIAYEHILGLFELRRELNEKASNR